LKELRPSRRGGKPSDPPSLPYNRNYYNCLHVKNIEISEEEGEETWPTTSKDNKTKKKENKKEKETNKKKKLKLTNLATPQLQ
jgi:hypothetical protein